MKNADKVFHYFEEISKIPRSSGDEKAISDYLVAFAKERGLEVIQDSYYNVIIKKQATKPRCTCAPVIVQGHTDMVYVREDTCQRRYEDGIGLIYKDGWLSADGTTLGADNGIAVVYALALLDSEDIIHPDIEAVFTVSEEIGLIGAEHLDYSKLRGKYLLNIDTEDEGIFYTSCAGAFRNEIKVPIKREIVQGLNQLTVKIRGLKGGHSGMEINEGRANALSLLARLLSRIGDDAHVASLKSEGKTNAICNNATTELFVEDTKLDQIESFIKEMESEFKNEHGSRDSIIIEIHRGEKCSANCYTNDSRKRITAALMLLPCGVIGMSHLIPGLVETSANPAYLEESEGEITILSSARSSVGSIKAEMKDKYKAIANLCGGVSECSADYPQWEYRENSPLRELAMKTYKELFNKEAETRAIHAGLECGYFDEKIRGVDIISFGPDLYDVHTPLERANIESVERMWTFTQVLLEKLAE